MNVLLRCAVGAMVALLSGGNVLATEVMSYCNDGAACATDNQLQFNNTQISATLAPNIAAATPACLLTDRIFGNGFN